MNASKRTEMELFEFLNQNMWLMIFFLGAGMIAGITAGLFGIGGGIVMVPILYNFSEELGIPEEHKIQIIMATSLFMVCINGLISAYFRFRYKEIDLKIFFKWLPALILGAATGACLNIFTKASFVTVIFAVFCVITAFKMFFGVKFQISSKWKINTLASYIIGFLLSAFSALIGIGGGALSVPILTFLGLPMKIATGTSSLFSATIALSAGTLYAILGMIEAKAMPYYQIGYVNWLALLFIIPTSIVGAMLGAKISTKLPTKILQKMFAALLLLSAFKMLYNIL